jgi:hypothetical protein
MSAETKEDQLKTLLLHEYNTDKELRRLKERAESVAAQLREIAWAGATQRLGHPS